MPTSAPRFLPRTRLGELFDALRARGYALAGPRVREGAIVYEPLGGPEQLPVSVRDRQAPGRYRLEEGEGPRAFAWANGPQALKPLVFRPRETLWRSEAQADGGLRFMDVAPEAEALAVFGVRACDLAGLDLQDRHFLGGEHEDAHYRARREALFLIAVDCTHPAATCFCASTGDGPGAESGFDLGMGELDEGFVVRAGSERGGELLAELALEPADAAQQRRTAEEVRRAAAVQQRALPSRDLREALFANLQHPRWEDVAGRCLSCGNCVSVCPSCFCNDQHEVPSLDGRASEHVREWDACFTRGHSYIHGIVIRADTRQRYRQWLTHKLGSWHDQYGRSGCVGCGRCIAWCPVGIDITEEAAAICGDAGAGAGEEGP